MNIRYASLTDVGVKRSHNQDACASQPASDAGHYQSHGHVFIVADGMGGHAVGEKASAKAVRDIPLSYIKLIAQEGVAPAIRRSFREANEAIYAIGQNNPEFKGLGTTATALFLRPEGAWIGHVGDSRAYRIRGGRVQQLTFDHSWVWEVARRQGIDPDELGDFKRNVIIRSLGPDAEVEVDVEGPHPVEPGDLYLLCSDGLSNLVPPDELGAVATTFPPDEACKYLVALSNLRGGPDNITCLIVQVPGGPGSGSGSGPGGGGAVGRLFGRLNKVVPWPFLALVGGAVGAGLSVWLQSDGRQGLAIGAFGAAAVLILCGLVGLYLHLRKRAEEAEQQTDETATELRVYRDHPYEVGKVLVDRFATIDGDLKGSAQGKDFGIDWGAHDGRAAEAEAAAKRSDWAGAFRAWFLAVQVLAGPLNKARQKDESFQPNWTGSHKALGG